MRMPESRNNLPLFLDKMGYKIGSELGVARGRFSRLLLKRSSIKMLYSIDKWDGGRGHDAAQYFRAMNALHGFGRRSMVLRMSFDEAKDLFEDKSLDFIYIDAYAHETGLLDKTLKGWWPKVKKGGLIAGHDYCEMYHKVRNAVDRFILKYKLDLYITNQDRLPSWMAIK
jgi:predicted O-methyltransferase YrrM